MALPDQLLLSDLLRHRVRCDRGLDHGSGVMGWMHPPVHRLLGWVSRPSGFGRRRLVWRLDQLRDLTEQELLVVGDPAETDPDILERLPTLLEAALLGQDDRPLGTLADAAVELRSGRIQHYLVSRSDPRLPGSSRWRLSPDRILGVETGGCPHTAIREDASMNLVAIETLEARFDPLDFVFVESGGDNLASTFSPELVDLTLYVIDVAAGDKIPRKGGPGITKSDFLVINKIDLAPLVGASLTVMEQDARRMRGDRPFGFTNLKTQTGLATIIDFIQYHGGSAPG